MSWVYNWGLQVAGTKGVLLIMLESCGKECITTALLLYIEGEN